MKFIWFISSAFLPSLLNTDWCLPQLLRGWWNLTALLLSTVARQAAGSEQGVPPRWSPAILPAASCSNLLLAQHALTSLGRLTSLHLVWCWRQHYANYLLLMMSPK